MTQQESPAFEQLKSQLREMFQLDRGDLDFGLYRIMNQKRDDVSQFLDEQLLPQVHEILEECQSSDSSNVEQELKETIINLQDAGVDPETAPKVKKLRAKLSQCVDLKKLENEIYSDLYNFFKRYYSEGDFMSLRRYKEGVYALPYEGEEVKLHWANHDQYYIKTSENLKNYSFKTVNGKKHIRFELVAGGTETNNNKAANGKERRFILHEESPIQVNGDELVIRFEYRADDKGRKQDAINKEIVEKILSLPEILDFGLAEKAPTEKNKERTLLEKHLTDYTAKNSFDYFIHKDLGKFLSRELDFFIKNEIMYLDDIENETAPKVEAYLAKIKAMRKVARKIIQFLAQLENFQKKLWLKKKFVLETHYCVTLDHIIGSEVENELLPIIAENDAQREEWVKLFAIDELKGNLANVAYSNPLTVEFLKANDKLLVDTKFFDVGFKYTLLSIFDDLDEQTDGLLINSENFQALSFIKERYEELISCVHIDPPYNTQTSGFLYKNAYQHSSWLTMMKSRLGIAASLLTDEGSLQCHIDEHEYEKLFLLFDTISIPNVGTVVWDKRNPMLGRKGVATQHEYVIWRSNVSQPIYQRNVNVLSMLSKVDELIQSYGVIDESVRKDFSDWVASNKDLSGGEKAYKFIDDDGRIYRGVAMGAPETRTDAKYFIPLKHPTTGKNCPIPNNGFSRTPEKINKLLEAGLIIFGKDETVQPQKKVFLTADSQRQISSVISEGRRGKNDVDPMEFEFSYCHPVNLYELLIGCASSKANNHVLDYFAGSGTTGHAVINLNREDEGSRKYILVEMGTYFNTVLKPRIQKVSYSSDWKNGKPISREGVSQIIKYMSLEQYEDALDNLVLSKTETQAGLLNDNPALNEQYMLSYMLDVESRGSQSLLNIDAFANPFSYKLRITRNDDTQVINVDLIETFNYLLGLTVRTINRDDSGIVTITGKNSLNEDCLIIWRNAEDINNDKLDKWFKILYKAKDFVFDTIYVNGDNNIENMKLPEEHWQVRLIEAEFKRLMFDVQDV